MINIIKSNDSRLGIDKFVKDIVSRLGNGESVLWLVSGGSNIPISVEIMHVIRKGIRDERLGNLTIALTDERFGPIGHKDSNWKQLDDAVFDFSDIKTIPVLVGSDIGETVSGYSQDIENTMNMVDCVIAQFGIGTDGHIAGILPSSQATISRELVCHFKTETYDRITLTFKALKRVNTAYTFVFGDQKKEAILRLRNGKESIDKLPAMILDEIPESIIFTDQ